MKNAEARWPKESTMEKLEEMRFSTCGAVLRYGEQVLVVGRELAQKQKRAVAKEKAVENEKYAFRCFLLRLGMIGDDYKTSRRILLQNLTGSSAFKCGHRKEAASHEVSE